MLMIRKLLAVLVSLVTCHVTSSKECRDCHDHEAGLNISPTPLADEGKHSTPLLDLMEEFRCYERTEYKMPDQETWMILRKLYEDIVGEDSTIAPLSEESGMNVPFYVENVPGKGRAVFASQPVKKGTLIWGERQIAYFFDIDDFRKFIVSLPSRDLACDVLIWSWGSEPEGDEFYMSIALDEGSLFNDSKFRGVNEEKDEDDGTEMASTGCIDDTTGEIISGGDCLINYALRDIEAGEEFTCDYSDFADEELNAHCYMHESL